MDTIIKLATTDTDTERLLKGSVLLEAEKQAHKRTYLRELTLMQHLSLYLEREERRWDSDEQFENPEDAKMYLESAGFMRSLGRKDDRIEAVRKWYNEYLPWS